MATVPREAGKSSFDLLDQDAFAAALPLESARRVLDLGCGAGAYTLFLAERLGPGATVHGVDLWADGVSRLLGAARERGLGNVTAEVGDFAHLESVPDGEADLALLATVAHDLAERGTAAPALREAARVLGPGRWLAVLEFRKADTRPGPPLAIRLSPYELAALVEPCGFGPPRVADLGPHLYAALFPRGALRIRPGRAGLAQPRTVGPRNDEARPG
jgi:ubiquinone/menaquinone biosynthesis C-methylase UbiE